MNIKEYIESGIIGTYVLGLATEAEQTEFEYLCSHNPELREAKRLFELTLETQLIKEAVPLPAGLKEKILKALDNPVSGSTERAEEQPNTPIRTLNVWKMLSAACVLLLAGSMFLSIPQGNIISN